MAAKKLIGALSTKKSANVDALGNWVGKRKAKESDNVNTTANERDGIGGDLDALRNKNAGATKKKKKKTKKKKTHPVESNALGDDALESQVDESLPDNLYDELKTLLDKQDKFLNNKKK